MFSSWSKEEIFLDGDHYFSEICSAIDQAKASINVEIYIFNDDKLGMKIADHLINAHKRGVKVQVIVDGVGSYNFFRRLYPHLAVAGIAAKMYNPLPFYHPFYGQLSLKKKFQVFTSRLGKVNSRNHRKIITIDEKIMFVGSFNFTSEHTSFHHEKQWKDMGVRVEGEHVKFAVLNFKQNWKFRDYFRYRKAHFKQVKRVWKLSPLRLNNSLIMRRHYQKDFIKRLNKAEKRIWLITPYFIPKRKLIRVLAKAAKRGVDVRLLISLKNDVPFFHVLQSFYYPYLIKRRVKVYQYTETVLHAKNFIIDDWTTIGTTNLNHRSLVHDLEVDLVIQQSENIKLIEDNFLKSIENIGPMTNESLKQRSFFDRMLSRVLFTFKYWF